MEAWEQVASAKTCPICAGNGTVGEEVPIRGTGRTVTEPRPCPFCKLSNRISALEHRMLLTGGFSVCRNCMINPAEDNGCCSECKNMFGHDTSFCVQYGIMG